MKRHYVWFIWDTLRVAGIELGNHLAFEQADRVARMRESMARLTPSFSTNRAVREYTEQHYLPACWRRSRIDQFRNIMLRLA